MEKFFIKKILSKALILINKKLIFNKLCECLDQKIAFLYLNTIKVKNKR